MNRAPLTAFTWGYWGWGNAVPQFLQAAASAEAATGWDAPAFADVRLSRSVRAPGFRGSALEPVVGPDRYAWFGGLGNAKIATHETGVRIAKPKDVDLLLDFVIRQAASRRRVLFFCACPVHQPEPCHRHTVATLLLDAARARRVALRVVEWPGGEPEARDIRIRAGKVTRGRTTIPLGKRLPADGLATLPWGSTVHVRLGKETCDIVSGPALFRAEWALPIIHVAAEGEGTSVLQQRARDFRTRFNCEPRCS